MRPGISDTLLEIRRFPLLEQNIVRWLALDTVPICRGDVLILGHVREYLLWLLHCDNDESDGQREFASFSKKDDPAMYFNPVETRQRSMDDLLQEQRVCVETVLQTGGDFHNILQQVQPTLDWCNWAWEILPLREKKSDDNYGAKPLSPELSVKRIFLLGARYSYWGNMVHPIALHVYSVTDFIIYGAKCGTMTSAQNIETIVIPHEYAIVEEPTTSAKPTINILNRRGRQFLFSYKGLQLKWRSSGVFVGGIHVSVPTLVGETYNMTKLIDSEVAADFEVRKIAAVLSAKISNMDFKMKKDRLNSIKALPNRVAMVNALAALAYECLPQREAASIFGHNALNQPTKSTPSSANIFELLSMDNETSWFAVAAASIKCLDQRPKFFQVKMMTKWIVNIFLIIYLFYRLYVVDSSNH